MVENNILLQSHSKPFKTRILKTKLLHYLLSENNIYTVCTNVPARAGRIRQAFWKKHKTARQSLTASLLSSRMLWPNGTCWPQQQRWQVSVWAKCWCTTQSIKHVLIAGYVRQYQSEKMELQLGQFSKTQNIVIFGVLHSYCLLTNVSYTLNLSIFLGLATPRTRWNCESVSSLSMPSISCEALLWG